MNLELSCGFDECLDVAQTGYLNPGDASRSHEVAQWNTGSHVDDLHVSRVVANDPQSSRFRIGRNDERSRARSSLWVQFAQHVRGLRDSSAGEAVGAMFRQEIGGAGQFQFDWLRHV